MLTAKVHFWVQVIALFFQIVMPTIPGITLEWQHACTAFVSFLQGAVALAAQWKNPDGTPARVGYEPKP